MDEATRIEDALKALISSGTNRSKMAFLRQVLPQIEAAQQSGITHEKILKTLNEHGFGVESQKTYAAMLSRVRIKSYGARRYSKAMVEEKKEAKEVQRTTFSPKDPGAPKKFDWDLEENNTKKLW